MTINIIEKNELNALISPQRNKNIPVHNWFSFKHGFSKELIENLIQEFKLEPDSWVLDPFCGSGTTLLTCKQNGINSIGFDILPFSVFLSNVKTKNYNPDNLIKQLNIFPINNKNSYTNIILPDIPILNKAFKPEVKEQLLSIKNEINGISNLKTKDFFTLGFLSILESFSNTSKTGGFLRIIERSVCPNNIRYNFRDKINSMIKDVVIYNKNKNGFKKVNVIARLGDARKLNTKKKFDAIITSPPYPNRHDYTRIYSLEMIFEFISSNDELKKIRYETIRSHVEARKKYEVINYIIPDKLKESIEKIEKNGTNNPQIINMLLGYFEDMFLSLSEMKRCLQSNGKIALVVSNVRFSGVNIPVDEILGEIGIQTGLKFTSIWVVRKRGNSSQQMKKYQRIPSRESIIFWGH